MLKCSKQAWKSIVPQEMFCTLSLGRRKKLKNHLHLDRFGTPKIGWGALLKENVCVLERGDMGALLPSLPHHPDSCPSPRFLGPGWRPLWE